MNIGIQIGIGLLTGFAVFVASLEARKRGFVKLMKTLSSLTDKFTEDTGKVMQIIGARDKTGHTHGRVSPQSPMTISLKMSLIQRRIAEMKLDLSEEEKIWLTVLMLLPSWDDMIYSVLPDEDMPHNPVSPKNKEKISSGDVKFAEREKESATAVALIPHHYMISVSPEGRYTVKDGSMTAGKTTPVASDIATMKEAIDKMCQHHNRKIDIAEQERNRKEIAAKKLEKDLHSLGYNS